MFSIPNVRLSHSLVRFKEKPDYSVSTRGQQVLATHAFYRDVLVNDTHISLSVNYKLSSYPQAVVNIHTLAPKATSQAAQLNTRNNKPYNIQTIAP